APCAAADELDASDKIADRQNRVNPVRSMTPPNAGADVVYEAAGVPIAFREALRMIRRYGTVVETGHFTPRRPEPFDAFEICSTAGPIHGQYGLSNQAWVAGPRFLGPHPGKFPLEVL